MYQIRWRIFCSIIFSGIFFAESSIAADLEFDEYLQRAVASRNRGDWESTANQYARALNHSDAPTDARALSELNLEYGRALGVLCQYTEAEKYLRTARELADKAKFRPLRALIEMASLNTARKNFPIAVEQFAMLVPMLEQDKESNLPPILKIDAIEKYALALSETGKAADAELRRREAARLRDGISLKVPPATITPYGAQCSRS